MAKKIVTKLLNTLLAAIVGGVITAMAIMLCVEPEVKIKAVIPYEIDTGSHQLDGNQTTEKYNRAVHYLYDWQHIFMRQRGVDILEDLANKGLIRAITELSRYYAQQSVGNTWRPQFFQKMLDKSHLWAQKAANAGDVDALAIYTLTFQGVKDLDAKDLAQLERFAKYQRGVAYALSVYYENSVSGGTPRDAKKAVFWQNYMHTHKYETSNNNWQNPVRIQQRDYLLNAQK